MDDDRIGLDGGQSTTSAPPERAQGDSGIVIDLTSEPSGAGGIRPSDPEPRQGRTRLILAGVAVAVLLAVAALVWVSLASESTPATSTTAVPTTAVPTTAASSPQPTAVIDEPLVVERDAPGGPSSVVPPGVTTP